MGSSKDDDNNSAINADAPAADLPDSVFSEGEKVLAYHGPRIYQAKVQITEVGQSEWKYHVHYLGWNKNWDEWVGADRLLKLTEENILKQKELDEKQREEKNPKPARPAIAKSKTSTDVKLEKEDSKSIGAKGKKRKADSVTKKDNASVSKLMKIHIPSTLKKQLVDDWDFVTQQNKLVKLPRSPNVNDILTKYIADMPKKDGVMNDSVEEILNGLRCYFDKSLSVILLYNNERQHYKETILDNISPSSIYGAEHLLRLFVKLPQLMASVTTEEQTMVSLQQKLLDFLKFLQKNQSIFFLSAYDEVSESNSGKDK